MDSNKKICELFDRKVALREYLRVMIIAQDWHAVRDCAVDLEIIDKEISIYKEG